MLTNLNKGITEILYNHLNLPTQISFANGNSIEYLYNAAGQKIEKKVHDTQNNALKQVEYLDGFQTEERGSRIPKKKRSHKINNSEQNHTATLASFDLEILNFQNLTRPFGLKHAVFSDIKQKYELDEEEEIARPTYVYETEYQYKYNGKEWQDELNLNVYDYGARNYDPAIGRFMSIDPLAEKYVYNSTYAFQENKMGMGRELEGLELVSNLGRNYHWGALSAPSVSYSTTYSKSSARLTKGKEMPSILKIFDKTPSYIEIANYSTTTTSYSYSKDGAGAVNSIEEADYLEVATTTRTFTATEKGGFGVGANEMELSLKVETSSTIYLIEEGEVLGVADIGGVQNKYSTTQIFDVVLQELPEQLQKNIEQYKEENDKISITNLRGAYIEDTFHRLDWEYRMENP